MVLSISTEQTYCDSERLSTVYLHSRTFKAGLHPRILGNLLDSGSSSQDLLFAPPPDLVISIQVRMAHVNCNCDFINVRRFASRLRFRSLMK